MNYFNEKPSGISQIAILAIVLVLAVILAGGVYLYMQNQGNTNGNANTNTAVNLNMANENLNITTNLNTNTLANLDVNSVVNQNFNVNAVTKSNVSANTNVNTVDWKTYQDDEFGFSFQYPKEWRLSTDPNGTISVVPPIFQEPLPLIKAVAGTTNDALKWLNENRTEPGSGTFQKTNDIYNIMNTTGSIYRLGGNRFAIVELESYSIMVFMNVVERADYYEEYLSNYKAVYQSLSR